MSLLLGGSVRKLRLIGLFLAVFAAVYMLVTYLRVPTYLPDYEEASE